PLAGTSGRRIRKVATDGTITTIAGTGLSRAGADGCPATNATFIDPAHLALGPDGSLYIVDRSANQVRKLSGGCISTFAGRSSGGGSRGDGDVATAANFDGIVGVAVGPDGSVYISDRNNHRIRVVDPTGIVFPFAGDPAAGRASAVNYGEFDPSFV